MFTTVILSTIFAAIMLATLLLSGFPGITIKLMHLFGWYSKQYLYNDRRNYVDGSGVQVYRRVYILIVDGKEKWINLQVFLRLLMITTVLSALISCIVYFIIL